MNYKKVYDKLISKYGRPNRPAEGYYEKHHIKPKSMGGSDESHNLVYLTAREHYIAHFLLWKIHRNKQMAFAFHNMSITSYNRKRVYSSRKYENCRKDMAISMQKENPMKNPEIAKKVSGDNHFMKSKEVRDKYSKARKGEGNPCWGKRGPRATKIMTPSGEFSSIKAAANYFKIDPNTVYRRMRQEPTNWFKLS